MLFFSRSSRRFIPSSFTARLCQPFHRHCLTWVLYMGAHSGGQPGPDLARLS